MNIVIDELQVMENRAITKRIAGIIGEDISAMETYSLTAEPDSEGAYASISIKPVSFDYYGGVIIKGDGVSEYIFNETSMAIGKTIIYNGPTPKNESGEIGISPLYKIIDTAVVSAAAKASTQPEAEEYELWDITLTGKNYLYSAVYGTPITGKLAVVGRSFILSTGRRLAKIYIDQVLQEGDVLADMTSDEYNARVAQEIQRKLDYFFGTGYATASYNTAEQRHEIIMATAGSVNMTIGADTTEDLAYFGFVSPTYVTGSEPLSFPRLVMMTGDLTDMNGYVAEITAPSIITAQIPKDLAAEAGDFVGKSVLVANAEALQYEIIIYK